MLYFVFVQNATYLVEMVTHKTAECECHLGAFLLSHMIPNTVLRATEYFWKVISLHHLNPLLGGAIVATTSHAMHPP
jgi:hypothetical protein